MINLGSLGNLTNEELLRELDEIREKSPIISELCKRLDQNIDIEKEIEEINNKIEEINNKAECPVCMVALHAEMDIGSKIFKLQICKY